MTALLLISAFRGIGYRVMAGFGGGLNQARESNAILDKALPLGGLEFLLAIALAVVGIREPS